MSIQSIISSIATVDREIYSYQQQISTLNNSINNKQKEGHRILETISKEKNLTKIATLQKDLTKKNEEIVRIEKAKAGKEKYLADKQKRKYELQQQLTKEEQKGREITLREQKEILSVQQEISREMDRQNIGARRTIPTFKSMPLQKQYDVFVSHASEDKADFVRPFVDALVNEGLIVWYDEFELSVGMSLRRSIDAGLSNSKFGIVVLSENFLKKEWPQRELDGLFAKEVNGQKVILPLWHKISKNEVISYSPIIADLVALNTSSFTFEELAKEIAKAVKK